jgi:hypothetical protein
MDIPDLPVIDELIRCIPTIDDAECLIRLEDIFVIYPKTTVNGKAQTIKVILCFTWLPVLPKYGVCNS